MAGASAYRYDHSAQPARRPQATPNVRVVRGTKQSSHPVLSDAAVTLVKAVIVCMVVFLAISFVRVWLASEAYGIASTATELSAEVADARSASESLTVQKSLISSPSNIRNQAAAENLNMSAPAATTTLTLPVDVVVTDEAGNLSFAQSISALASQG